MSSSAATRSCTTSARPRRTRRAAGSTPSPILAFASLNDVEDYLVSADHAAIEASESRLAGEGSEFWTAVNYSIINRLMPELATERP